MKHSHPIQISIPQPCSEDWNKMTPLEQGRFCDSCQKCVVDLTGFTDEQLYKYFAEHKDEKVCGRFQNWQLKRQVALPPEPRNRFYKWFISLGFVIFLAELFVSEAKAQEAVKTESITGKVANMKGKPLKDIAVTIYNTTYSADVRTNSEGHFLMNLPNAGSYNISMRAGDYKTTTIENIIVDTSINTKLIIGLHGRENNDTAQTIHFEKYERQVLYENGEEDLIITMGQVRLNENLYIVNNPKRRSLFSWLAGRRYFD